MSYKSLSPSVFDYLDDSHSVLLASGALAEALAYTDVTEARDDEIADALARLQELLSAAPARQPAWEGFSNSQGSAAEPVPLTIDDTLAMAEADATVAHVLFVASDAVESQAQPAESDKLRFAVQAATADLTDLRERDALALGFKGVAERRFTSPDLAQAVKTFHAQTQAALDKIVEECEKGIEKIFDLLKEKREKILEAFPGADEVFEAWSKAPELLRRAWEKLLSALRVIRDLAAQAPFAAAMNYLKELAASASLRRTLEALFQAPSLRTEVEALHPKSLSSEQLDERSTEMLLLQERFATLVGNVRSVTKIVAVASPFFVWHFTGPLAPLAAPAAYSLAIVAI